MDVLGSNVDWFARLLGVFAILISAVALYLRFKQTRQWRPIIKVESSSIRIEEDFDEYSRRRNSDLLRRYSEYRLPFFLIPLEVHLVVKNEGLVSSAVTVIFITLQSSLVHALQRVKLFFLEEVRGRRRMLGDLMYLGREDEPPLYLGSQHVAMRLPYNLQPGSLTEYAGTLYLDLRMPVKAFENYKRLGRKLETPLDYVDFVSASMGYSAEEAYFTVLLKGGARTLCKTRFNRNRVMEGYWFSQS